MKILFASDLHGSAKYCRRLIEVFASENADKLVLLGDVLYHGPRNPLPEEYAPQQVVNLLESVKDKTVCVRGNCDADIDADLLPFPLLSQLGLICVDGLNIYFAHGHLDTPPLSLGDVYVTGHTHVQLKVVEDGYYHLNPGSLALPKENSARGYIIYENRTFTFKDADGNVLNVLNTAESVAQPAPQLAPQPDLHTTEQPDGTDAPAVQTERAAAEPEQVEALPVRRQQVVRRRFVIRKK